MNARRLLRLGLVVLSLGLFVYGLFLLSLSTSSLRPVLSRLALTVLDGPAAALGMGWLAASVLMNGSTVAAVALTLHHVELIPRVETFFLIAGSRIGAAFFVVLLGVWTAWRRRDRSLAERTSMGLLDFLVALSVYAPVAMAGPVLLRFGGDGVASWLPAKAIGGPIRTLFDPFLTPVVESLNPGLGAALGVGLLLLSLRLFEDEIGELAGSDGLRSWIEHAARTPLIAFGLGGALTLLTASVSVSVGLLVPFYGQGLVRRRETVPYLLGANVTTLGDTLVAAVALGSPGGFAVVVLMALAGAAASTVYMGFESTYRSGVMGLLRYLLGHPARLALFLVLPGLIPLLMVLL